MKIIKDAGELALSSRLQSLAEQLRKDGALFYNTYGIAFEPKWFPVILVLAHQPLLTVSELSTEIGYSHPSTISLLKELEKEKLILSRKDKIDERKRRLRLSSKGEKLVEKLKPIWSIMKTALTEITTNNDNLLKAIEQAEEALERQSFLQRAIALKS